MIWIIAVVCLHCGLAASATNYSDCPNKLSVLEQILFEYDNNELELNKAFFPPRQPTSRYIMVQYTFENFSEPNPCTVNYTWSVGGFLLIQPPSLFQFSSLLFSVPVNDVYSIELVLPNQCRPLVQNISSGKCSCSSNTNSTSVSMKKVTLDILTQQVSF